MGGNKEIRWVILLQEPREYREVEQDVRQLRWTDNAEAHRQAVKEIKVYPLPAIQT
jgi:hypothetical protein